MKTPQFLQRLLSSAAYMDKNSNEYAMAEKYLKMLYPGTLQSDASGRLVMPEYDMTLQQFNAAQAELDAELEEAIADAEAKYEEETGEPASFNEYIELTETINVMVLMPDGTIEKKQLEVYTLELPDSGGDMPPDKTRRVFRWHSEIGKNTCDECASHNGKTYINEDDIPEIPIHPNCRCSITEDEIEPDGRTVSSKPYNSNKGTKKMTKDEKFEEAYNKLKEPEGKYTDGKNQIRDEPTNMGIKQSTLDNYASKHPGKNLPKDVKNLEPSQAKEIYKAMYWDNTKIPQIENNRVRDAMFDMGVMSGPTNPTKTLQLTLNEQFDTKLPISGYLGDQTIKAINSIPKNKIDHFMNALIENRMQSLQGMRNWPTAKNGWTKRTRAY